MDFNFLVGIQNFINLINENWTLIIICIGLVITLINRIRNYLAMSDQDRIQAVKTLIKEVILEKVTNAEIQYEDWEKAGAIKRAQVIEELYSKYPILRDVIDQEALIKWIDEMIDEALLTMREIFKKNTEQNTEQ